VDSIRKSGEIKRLTGRSRKGPGIWVTPPTLHRAPPPDPGPRLGHGEGSGRGRGAITRRRGVRIRGEGRGIGNAAAAMPWLGEQWKPETPVAMVDGCLMERVALQPKSIGPRTLAAKVP